MMVFLMCKITFGYVAHRCAPSLDAFFSLYDHKSKCVLMMVFLLYAIKGMLHPKLN
jgi:hypothetical protein